MMFPWMLLLLAGVAIDNPRPVSCETPLKVRWAEAFSMQVPSASEALRIIETEPSYRKLVGATLYLIRNHSAAIEQRLVEDIGRRSEVGLTEADINIVSRSILGDKDRLEDLVDVEDDLFTLPGRANWALTMIYCRRMDVVRLNSGRPRLMLIQQLWKRLIGGSSVGLAVDDPRIDILSENAISRDGLAWLLWRIELAGEGERRVLWKILGNAVEAKLPCSLERWRRWLRLNWNYLFFDWRTYRVRVSKLRKRGIPEAAEFPIDPASEE